MNIVKYRISVKMERVDAPKGEPVEPPIISRVDYDCPPEYKDIATKQALCNIVEHWGKPSATGAHT
jgi:hypothetical protein